MGDNIITDLYVDLYWRLYRIFKNENVAVAADVFLLVIFQLLNIYSIIVFVQKLLKVDFTGYLFGQPVLIISFCAVIIVLNFFAGKRAKKAVKKLDSEVFVSRRFTTYAILSIILFIVSRYLPK
jgi:hypothetical protein